MAQPKQTYHVRVRGLSGSRHEVADAEGTPLGVLVVRRNRAGMVVAGTYRPEKGEVLELRREPGLLRAQFSVWTDEREWLGSSIRPGLFRRAVEMWTSGRPYRLVPALGLAKGWRVVGTKTGLVAEIRHPLVGRSAEIHVHRKFDFELVLFAYFLGSLARWESVPPTSLEAIGTSAEGKARTA